MGSKLLLLSLLALAVSNAKADVVGSIQIGSETKYVWRQFGTVYADGNSVTVVGNSRAYVVNYGDITTLQGDSFYQMQLSGKTLSYDADLSRVPCHCNGAAYFSKMPGYTAGDGLDYYCDANYVGGVGCPEYDAVESNKHTIATTLHNCGWDGSWFVDCDGGGCGTNIWDVDSSVFGQGKTIDTSRPVTFSHYNDGSTASTSVSQDGNSFTFGGCGDGGYVAEMDSVSWQDGMVLVFSEWGEPDQNTMGWLDDKTGCQPEGGVVGCDINSAQITFSNFNLY